MWRYQKKPKKGMLTLHDLDRCQEDQGCNIGLRQVVPGNYLNAFPEDDRYTPTHLVWPEFMPSDPSYRLATFTLTNMAPLLKSLYKEWRAAVLKVRQFALEQCHIPYSLDLNANQPGQQSTHRSHKSALYIASGVLPNIDPVVTTGHDVHVPFLFWMSGCCVQQNAQATDPLENSNSSNNTQNVNLDEAWDNDVTPLGAKTNVSAFAVYISNAAGSGVIAAPVLQLETLLQGVYKTDLDLDNVILFPGHDSVCSELKNDVSPWFQ
ncbi:endonuclease domain-containing 1 protein [Elysia marginata]|uniref:Endonuclease domain-containing 1 protein n=1 Tax=Elysia marginata TaxID=1093978 RepID=A0AAV4F536_9GAST|nr:endonuclease domain-containing 1 protein [Elysia marginata]